MYERPINVVMAAVLTMIGGIVALVFLGVAFATNDLESGDFSRIALAMLMAVLFFGFAGQCFPNGKGGYGGMVLLGLITVIASAALIITDVDNNLYFGIAFFVLAALATVLILPTNTEKWVNIDRE